VKLGTLLYGANEAITSGSILSIAAGFTFEVACDAALDTLTGGVAAPVSAIGCAVGGSLVSGAVDKVSEGK
jgi:hypothetical protein